jgi:hypothetical protein
VSEQAIKDYMYPIHMATRLGEKAGLDMLHVFWRMPMPGSVEYYLKEQDRWADYKDPNRIKFQPTFIVDPSKGLMDNLRMAYIYETPWMRKAGTYAGIALAQEIRLVMGVLGTAGTAIRSGIEWAGKKQGVKVKWLDDLTHLSEENKQMIDEISGSAAFPYLALSDFYKESENAKIFKESMEEAQNTHKPLTLDDKKGWKAVRPPEENAQGKAVPGKPVERLNKEWYKKGQQDESLF